jgi:D-beta-D-heptose 7-phosphate kinase/D-beta-D-heptose 1-phosphate adenosyltransferase
MKLQELTLAISKFGGTPVLVIGDLMIDEYLWGHVDRISHEAPVQIVDIVKKEQRLGGAGNVVKNLVSLGARVSVCSVVDEGQSGKYIIKLLKDLGVMADCVFTEREKISSKKTRILSAERHQQILRIDYETTHPISGINEQKIIKHVKENIDSFRAIILSDYKKGVLTEVLLRDIIEIASRKTIPVIVDPKGRDYSKYKNASLITLNRKEAETVLNCNISDEKSLRRAGNKLLSQLNAKAVLITQGKDGLTLFRANNRVTHTAGQERKVYDVTGAGDTVTSLLGLGMASGLELGKAIDIANIAAGIAVEKIGTAAVSMQEIFEDTLQRDVYLSEKILSLPKLIEIVADSKSNGRTIVFTNGCFDILHVGHITILQQAKNLGDILIVGLNSDESVRRLKGQQRPIIPLKERVAILSSLASVDYITVFEDDKPIDLLKAIKPDILVKGSTYTIEEVVGHEIVESYGGRIELIEQVTGVSTTSIIDRIIKSRKKESEKEQ